jgi:hypothetical protein
MSFKQILFEQNFIQLGFNEASLKKSSQYLFIKAHYSEFIHEVVVALMPLRINCNY